MRNTLQWHGIGRKSVLLGSAAVLAVLAASESAQAQCTSNGVGGALSYIAPFARGGSVNALVSMLNTSTTVFQAQTGSAFVSSPANAAPGEQGGGVWTRALGGQVDTKNSSTAVLTGSAPVIGVGALSGTVNCNTKTHQDFVGYQFGRDIAKLNWDGWNVHLGATAGLMYARAHDKTADLVTPATFGSTTQAPFFGSYVTVTKGGFFADAQVRWDYYNMGLNDPGSALLNQSLNARGWSIGGGIGYNQTLGNNWFIEPSAGFIYSKLQVDPLGISGINGIGNLTSLPGTVRIDDIKSELGRASIRIGTNLTTPYAALQPFVTASVFHEFAGDVTTRINSVNNPFITVDGVLTTDRVGTYGQISAGVAGQVLNTGWLGYARGDYRFGDKIDGWTLSTGLRYQFTPELLAAAPVGKHPIYKATPAPVVAAPVNWTGFYAGVHAGTIWGRTKETESFFGQAYTANLKYAGALLGGQAGYNYQFGSWVAGLEGDISWSNAKGATGNPVDLFFIPLLASVPGLVQTDQTKIDWFATVAPRFGYAWDRTLFYVKGGLALADVKQEIVSNTPLFVLGSPGSVSKTMAGWVVGAGAEFALTANWSAKAEYLFYDLGSKTFSGYTMIPGTIVASAGTVDADIRGGIAKIGLNYRFSPTLPVVAKY